MMSPLGAIVLSMSVIGSTTTAAPQTKPTPAEIEQWKNDRDPKVLESARCNRVTWLLEAERGKPPGQRSINLALGWWGRGFIEGAVYILGGRETEKKMGEFGLSVEVVAAHIAAYCYDHQAETPLDAVQSLLLKVLK